MITSTDIVPSILQVYGNPLEGMTLDERLDCLHRLNIVNKALEDCFRGEISFMDWLALAESHDVPVEEWLNSFDHNLKYCFGIDIDLISGDNFYLS